MYIICIFVYVHPKSLQLCQTLCDPTRLPCSWDFPGKNTGMGCHALLQRIFPTQESNPRLLCLLHGQLGSLPLMPPGIVIYLTIWIYIYTHMDI